MKKALRYAFPLTLPILAGYVFLSISFGILAYTKGIPNWVIFLMSLVIYAGSMQYAAIDVLLAPFNPIGAFMLTLMVNARHLFYGIPMLKKYKDLTGLKKAYTIFGLTDETFSLVVGIEIPPDIDRSWVYFHITWLNQFYWLLGTIIGFTIGPLIPFNTEGIEFVLTALFVTIFVEQWLSNDSHQSALIGLGSGVLALILFGASSFLIPAMLFIIALFLAKYIKQGGHPE